MARDRPKSSLLEAFSSAGEHCQELLVRVGFGVKKERPFSAKKAAPTPKTARLETKHEQRDHSDLSNLLGRFSQSFVSVFELPAQNNLLYFHSFLTKCLKNHRKAMNS